MEFIYDKELLKKYLIFGIFTTVIALGLIPFIAMFTVIVVGVQLGLLWFGIGAIYRYVKFQNRFVIVEQSGVHFFDEETERAFIPWRDIDDFSVTGSSFKIKIGDKFRKVSKELKDYHEFLTMMVEQLALSPEKRGQELPRIDMPEIFGGTVVYPEEENSIFNHSEEELPDIEVAGKQYGIHSFDEVDLKDLRLEVPELERLLALPINRKTAEESRQKPQQAATSARNDDF